MTTREEEEAVQAKETAEAESSTDSGGEGYHEFGEGVSFERVEPLEPLRTVAAAKKRAEEQEEPCTDVPKRGFKSWVQTRAKKVVARLYESKADDIETRARRAVTSAYHESADDLEERAVRAMRRAIQDEADRIKEVIEHSVDVKKREVRLSLLVLVVASVVYLVLYLLTQSETPQP